MKTVYQQDIIQRALIEETWQDPFPEKVQCKTCSCVNAKPMLVISDDEGLISLQRKFVQANGIWPHDCLAIALYLCPECGEIMALWNQG